MANYLAICRTNYFKVKSASEFCKQLEPIPGIEIDQEGNTFCLVGDDPNGGGFPISYWDEENNEEIDFDIVELVSKNLEDGEVAIFIEVGAEKARYLQGFAQAVNSNGKTETISLSMIYDLARKLTDRPDDITHAEY